MKKFVQKLNNFIRRKLRYFGFEDYTFINVYKSQNSALKHSKKTTYYLDNDLDIKNITEFSSFENLNLENEEKRFKLLLKSLNKLFTKVK